MNNYTTLDKLLATKEYRDTVWLSV